MLTHSVPEGWPREDAPFTFVTEGIERAVAVASELVGEKDVGVNGGTIAPVPRRGLLDEIWVDLVPVLLGAGTPFFEQLAAVPSSSRAPCRSRRAATSRTCVAACARRDHIRPRHGAGPAVGSAP